MKTPLFFKLILMMALGLRLIYAARKKKAPKPIPYKKLEDFSEDTFYVNLEELYTDKPPGEQLKYIYRKYVRGQMDSKSKVLVFLAIELRKSQKKGSLFRFIWHRNEWLVTFYQSLHMLNLTSDAHNLDLAIEELTGLKLSETAVNELTPDSLFPNVERETPLWSRFEKNFNLSQFENTVLKIILTTPDK
ncbi:hypothetical protein [Jiulongibacter sp. NS-SX5]|uniref:hypothetical protein n=1 Tax=Jiulongibacter sp. NS-SX5 TaxID=3463854 RepID=UPI004057F01F